MKPRFGRAESLRAHPWAFQPCRERLQQLPGGCQGPSEGLGKPWLLRSSEKKKKKKKGGRKGKSGSLHALNLNLVSFRSSPASQRAPCFPSGSSWKLWGPLWDRPGPGMAVPAYPTALGTQEPPGIPPASAGNATGGNWDCPGCGVSQIPAVLRSWWQKELNGICPEELWLHPWKRPGPGWSSLR